MAFTPPDIGSCELWLRADDPTKLTDDPLRLTEGAGDIANGAKVYRWFDASGSATAADHTAVQTTTDYQPTYNTVGSIGGKPYLSFNTSLTASTAGGAVLLISDAAPGLLESLADGPGAGLGSYTFLFLTYQTTWTAAGYNTIASNASGGNFKFNFIRNPGGTTGKFVRFNGSTGVTMPQNQANAIAMTFACNGTANLGTETYYINDAAAVANTNTGGTPSMASQKTLYIGARNSTGAQCFANGQIYEILAFAKALTNTEIAQIYAYWNGKYGTSFGTSVGPLTAGTVTTASITQTGQTLTATSPTGGSAPYTYQWYRSTVSGALGSPIASATALTRIETGLTAQTNYYYTLRVTDNAGATSDTTQIFAPTHGTTTKRVGFIGDSIQTYTPGGINVPDQWGVDLFTTYRGADPVISNYAVSGKQARQLASTNSGSDQLAAILTTMGTDAITHCHIMIGTNDAYAQNAGDATFSAANYATDLSNIATRIAALGVTVTIHQIPWRSTSAITSIVQTYNAQIAGVCNGTTILQGDTTLYAAWTNNSTLNDGLHPTAAGVTDMAERWLAATPTSTFPPAISFTMTGPSGGATNVASTNFTLTPDSTYTGTITPSDNGGGGAFTPSSRTWAAEVGAKTFTYTPASGGTKTISASASPSLTAPTPLSYATPDSTAPTILSAAIGADGVTLTVTLSETCTLLVAASITLVGKTLSSIAINGSSLTATVATIVYSGVAVGELVVLAGAFEDASGNDVTAATVAVTNNSTQAAPSTGGGGSSSSSGSVILRSGPWRIVQDPTDAVALDMFVGDSYPLVLRLTDGAGTSVPATDLTLSLYLTDIGGTAVYTAESLTEEWAEGGVIMWTPSAPMSVAGTFRLTVKAIDADDLVSTFGGMTIRVSER